MAVSPRSTILQRPYSYPRDLALFVQDRWRGVTEPVGGDDLLPDAATLEEFLSACYHASMLREEERPVTFRVILAPPELFALEGRPPVGLQRLEFSRSFQLNPSEIRRLSVTVDPQRTLIGVRSEGEGGLQIWGLIQSGTRWLRNVRGGRRAGAPLPLAPVVHIEAPGSIEVYKGYELVGKLQGGNLSGSRIDLYESKWLPEQFLQFRDVLVKRHEASRNRARELSGETWAPLEPMLPRRIAERMLKRVLSLLRDARHGGTIVFFPLEDAAKSSHEDYIDLRYRFAAGPQLFFPDLIGSSRGRFLPESTSAAKARRSTCCTESVSQPDCRRPSAKSPTLANGALLWLHRMRQARTASRIEDFGLGVIEKIWCKAYAIAGSGTVSDRARKNV